MLHVPPELPQESTKWTKVQNKWCDSWGGAVQGQELDQVLREGTFQLSCDSVIKRSLRISTFIKPEQFYHNA